MHIAIVKDKKIIDIQIKHISGRKVKLIYHHRDDQPSFNFDEEIVGLLKWRNDLPGVAGIDANGVFKMAFLYADTTLYHNVHEIGASENVADYDLKYPSPYTTKPSLYDGKPNGAVTLKVID